MSTAPRKATKVRGNRPTARDSCSRASQMHPSSAVQPSTTQAKQAQSAASELGPPAPRDWRVGRAPCRVAERCPRRRAQSRPKAPPRWVWPTQAATAGLSPLVPPAARVCRLLARFDVTQCCKTRCSCCRCRPDLQRGPAWAVRCTRVPFASWSAEVKSARGGRAETPASCSPRDAPQKRRGATRWAKRSSTSQLTGFDGRRAARWAKLRARRMPADGDAAALGTAGEDVGEA
eukprot:scaffold291778_cov26-Tisochrysis_lutea.AAC.1